MPDVFLALFGIVAHFLSANDPIWGWGVFGLAFAIFRRAAYPCQKSKRLRWGRFASFLKGSVAK